MLHNNSHKTYKGNSLAITWLGYLNIGIFQKQEKKAFLKRIWNFDGKNKYNTEGNRIAQKNKLST